MEWDNIARDPRTVENYTFLKDVGILDFVDSQKSEIKDINDLLEEAYVLFQKESIEEIVEYILWRLSDKFIPSSVYIVLNEGIMVDNIKTIAYQGMQAVEKTLDIKSLHPFEEFFRKYTGTTSYLILKSEMDEEFLAPLETCFPEIIVPILGISGLYGVILFGEKILGEEYSPKEITYLNRLMKFTSISIQNSIHYHQSVKDSKTGLYNHNFFMSRLNEEIARSKRSHSVFSVLIMDIDKFKHFNDTYGHFAGDEVILKLAATIKGAMRECDILSRFGGEEFTILLPDTTPEQSWAASERLRKAVENMETPYQEHILKVTISIGIASIHPYSLGTGEELMKRADQALYQSKERGRNRSTHHRSGLLHQALDKEN